MYHEKILIRGCAISRTHGAIDCETGLENAIKKKQTSETTFMRQQIYRRSHRGTARRQIASSLRAVPPLQTLQRYQKTNCSSDAIKSQMDRKKSKISLVASCAFIII